MRFALVLLCLAAIVVAGEPEAEIRRLFAEIQRAERERDPDAALDRVDLDAFRARLERLGLPLPAAAAASAARRMFAVDQLGGFAGARIRKIEVAADGKSAFCVADHRSPLGEGRLRWRLVRTGEGWRLVDADVVDLSLTLSESLVMGFRAARDVHMHKLVGVMREVRQLYTAEEYERAAELLNGLERAKLPGWGRRLVRAMLASALVGMDQAAAALEEIDGVLAEEEPTPFAHYVRATALNRLERHAEALTAARAYASAVGPSAAGAFEIAFAQLRLKQRAAAEATCRAALKGDPGDRHLVFALVLALPDDRKPDIVAHLAALVDIEDALPDIVSDVVDEQDQAAVAALAAGADALASGGAVAAYVRGHVQYGKEQYDDAAASFRVAFERCENDWLAHYVLWYLDAMAEAGKVLPALDAAPDRGAAFRYLAGHLAYAGRDGDLAKLVAVRARDKDESADFHLWDAQVRFDAGDYEGALAILARHAKLLPGADPEHVWRIPEIKVKALVRLGRLVEADAASEDVDKLLRLVFVLATGDLAAATAAFKDALDDDWTLEEIWDDEDVARFLQTDKMKPLHEKYPQPKEDD